MTYIKAGYIKEDDAKNWNPDELLNNLRRANDETNRDRLVRGFPEIEILGWVQAPAYDASSHRLVWSASTRPKGRTDSVDVGVNYNTYALGRDGYFSLNLLTSSTRVNSDKGVTHELLAALSYNTGKRYEDFNASTDHIAEYGLAALVGGIAAKKLGLFALIGLFLLKFAKVIGIAAVAFGAGIWNLLSRRTNTASQSNLSARK